MNEPTLSPLEAEASSPSTDKGWYRIEPFNTTSTNTVSNQDTHSSTLSSVSTIRYEWNKRKQLYKQSNTNNTNDDDLDLAIECPLQPAWKMLLFGDGSPTKLLGLLTGYVRKFVNFIFFFQLMFIRDKVLIYIFYILVYFFAL